MTDDPRKLLEEVRLTIEHYAADREQRKLPTNVEAELLSRIDRCLATGGWISVGTVGSMPGTSGFTMATFKADVVPVGTELFCPPLPKKG
jgi:hypothetical protein